MKPFPMQFRRYLTFALICGVFLLPMSGCQSSQDAQEPRSLSVLERNESTYQSSHQASPQEVNAAENQSPTPVVKIVLLIVLLPVATVLALAYELDRLDSDSGKR